ncbi:integrase family protein [Natronomonas pharaonis DSM 2160]|uniref:Integrase family protein n=1 Tax=Natronomonas pharaonis (strain ATCC 35678 / DSM 2160 / CIP 103997 / JCM 8858 / NBRC 14720 / NCIMB 2260 / Gabara) TaxID=348780 RepID=A0A1U7EXW6_NATPD|nr:tyrosine-type recombinase/integrase [Natronomonas pharaonis]CAI50041.1 integrase family protein [Natronomonas pharaonis DSM 2160]
MGTRSRIENLQERIKLRSGLSEETPETDDYPQISDEDAEALLEFSKQLDLLSSEYSDYRHEKLLRHCVIMAEQVGGLAESLEDRDTAEDIVRWINTERSTEDYAEETNHDYRVAIRIFGKRTLKRDEVPEPLAWIPTGTSNSHDPTPRRSDMLEWEEAKNMADEGTNNKRDAALITVSYELGPRGEEMHEVRMGQVQDADNGLQIVLDGKQGEHSVTLINCGPYLQQWLADHPAPDDDEAYLWCNLDDPYDNASYQTFLERFKKAAERAGIDKPVTPTNFRKSNTYWLAKQGANESLINARQGRTKTSDHARRYLAEFGPENENKQYAELQGLEVETEKTKDRTPLTCPRCDKETPRDEPFCVWCHQAMEPEAVQELEEQEDEQRRKLLRIAQDNPELLETLEEMEPLIEALGGDAELIDTAASFTEAVE